MGLTFTTAFVAGMLSFISPCVLPLAPGYVAMISGVSVEELQRKRGVHWNVLLNAILFVLGFSILFVALGASAGAVGRFLSDHREIMNRIAGAVIVFFGAVLLGWIRIPVLYGEKRFQGTVRQGKLRSFLLGLAFAFGWTPCVGPALVAMLMLASTQQTVARGTALLSVYSAGLAVPFLLVALGTSQFLSLYQRWRSRLVWVERFAGAMLIAVGVLVFFDQLQELSYHLSYFNRFTL
jgi:cytochrome c-type biogenesis protein